MEEVKRYFKNVESTIEKDIEDAKELINLGYELGFDVSELEQELIEAESQFKKMKEVLNK